MKHSRAADRIGRWLSRRWRAVRSGGSARRRDLFLADRLIGRADTYRDAGRFGEAAALYAEALELDPSRSPIRVQAGHMFKEAGDHARAADHYAIARQAHPDDADLILQLGHFSKVVGEFDQAITYYEQALRLQPGWPAPLDALERLRQEQAEALKGDEEAIDPATVMGVATVPVPELLPRPPDQALAAENGVELLRYAQRRERSAWGLMPTLRGIEALRGYCIAATALTGVELLLDDEVVARAPVQHFDLGDGRTKHVFNLWHDFAAVPEGPHEVGVRLVGEDDVVRERRDRLLVRPPLTEADHPSSDGIVTVEPHTGGELEERIRARPSEIRPALRGHGWPVPRRVLVIRADQLGDLVVSVPAIRRLRALLPQAEIVGLLNDANAGIARRLALFDEVIVAAFPDEDDKGGRFMEEAEQERLQTRLRDGRFDLAIDLATSGMSRPLLLLTGATRTLGFGGEQWPWLSSELGGLTPDIRDRIEAVPHSSKIHSLIDRLATLLHSGAAIERLPEHERAALEAFPALAGKAYAVLHTGGRLAFSRWPGYPALAQRLIDERGLVIVLLTEDQDFTAGLPPALLADPRFVLVSSRLQPATLDALLGFAALVVANDSGPKHLAALRGAPVVSIHSARINWNEWGQEQTGVIVSRRVPCAGCAIHHDVENCGKDYACIADIRLDDVMTAISRVPSAPPPPAASSNVPAAGRPG